MLTCCKIFSAFCLLAEYHQHFVAKILMEVAQVNQPMKKSGKRNKGFYIALGVCLIAVGAAAWTTYSSVSNYTSPKTNVQSETKKTDNTVSGVNVKSSSSVPAKKTASSRPAASSSSRMPSKQAVTKPVSFILPVSGNVMQGFSKEPVFNKTFSDYRAHPGVDLKAGNGESVKSIADGTVEKVSGNDQYGNTVIVKHGALETWYCGLNKMSVSGNHSVKQGQQIGTVGIDPSNTEDGPHLHLIMKKDGEYIDPMSILK